MPASKAVSVGTRAVDFDSKLNQALLGAISVSFTLNVVHEST
jgi:hypothetical protein